MPFDRHLDWDGCCNVRDLGGLRTTLDTLASLDAEATLRAGGLGDGEVAALRARLLGLPRPGGR